MLKKVSCLKRPCAKINIINIRFSLGCRLCGPGPAPFIFNPVSRWYRSASGLADSGDNQKEANEPMAEVGLAHYGMCQCGRFLSPLCKAL